MSWVRVMNRNLLYVKEYDGTPLGLVKGDMKRLREDTLDERHMQRYAKHTGLTEEQVKQVFSIFFDNSDTIWGD